MYKRQFKGWAKHADFIIMDIICAQVSYLIAYFIYLGGFAYGYQMYRSIAIFLLLSNISLVLLLEIYRNVLKRGYYKEFVVCVKETLYLLLISVLYAYLTHVSGYISRILMILTFFIYFVLTYTTRVLYKKHLHRIFSDEGVKSLYILSSKNLINDILKKFKSNNYNLYKISGIILIDDDCIGKTISGIPVVCRYEEATNYFCHNWTDSVFVYLTKEYDYPKELINDCVMMGITIHLNLNKISEDSYSTQVVEKVGGYTVLTSSLRTISNKQAIYKRIIDILFGLVGSFITVILMIIIGPIIYICSPGPIFFTQDRVGQNGKVFKMYKFRSMYMDAEERKQDLMKDNKMNSDLMFKLDFDPRIIGNKILANGERKTGIGQFIRSTSIDEFPQFFNVLKGDMSVVGFRPILLSEYKAYEKYHRSRIAMKPGITGMWQVSGRSNITDFEEIVKLDNEYIKDWNIGLDIKIILKTILVVLKREGSL